jgi:hypothetical protein
VLVLIASTTAASNNASRMLHNVHSVRQDSFGTGRQAKLTT